MNVENTRASMSRALDIEVFKAYFFKAFLFSSVDLSTWFLARLRSYSPFALVMSGFPPQSVLVTSVAVATARVGPTAVRRAS